MGLKIWTGWGSEKTNSKTPSRVDFFEICLTSDFLKKNKRIPPVSDESCDSDPNPRFENKCKIEDSDSDSDSVKFKKLIRIRIRIRYF